MRLLLLVLLALSVATSAFAQDNNTTTTNETPTGNATNETPAEEPAAPAGPIEIILEGTNDLKFRTPDGKTNPTLTVQPGQKVTFKLKSVGGVHNLNIGGVAKTAFVSDGEEATLEWTAPTEPGRVEYWCDPHKSSGMKGIIQVGAPPATGGGGGEGGAISGETIDLGTIDPACAGKLAPAIVTTGITGSPTLDDYLQKCRAGDQPVTQERAKSGADYVIPISWLLIGLGVVGVVWVHKYYKP